MTLELWRKLVNWMTLERWRKAVNWVLAALVALDIGYIVIIFPASDLWFDAMHGADYVDPQGLLKRTAGLWTGFAVFQAIALVRWRRGPHWLMMMAGMRFLESFADWVYILDAHDRTWFGLVALLSASPTNIILGLFFYRAYLKFSREPAFGRAG